MASISDKAVKALYAANRYKYNGKELQSQEFADGSGMEEYEFEKRFFDPQLGRFFNIDPASENYTAFSPYTYGANNPLRFVDVQGMGPGDRIKRAQELEGKKYSQKDGLNTGTELRTGESDKALEYLDCSEFVCRVLAYDDVTSGVQQMSTADLVGFLADEDKFVQSDDDPQPGDVFLWRDGDDGHTGIVVSYDKNTGEVVTSEAKGEKWGSGQFTRQLSAFTSHAGWKGFYHPKKETADGKHSNNGKAGNNKSSSIESSQAKYKRLMEAAEKSLEQARRILKEKEKEKDQQRNSQQQNPQQQNTSDNN